MYIFCNTYMSQNHHRVWNGAEETLGAKCAEILHGLNRGAQSHVLPEHVTQSNKFTLCTSTSWKTYVGHLHLPTIVVKLWLKDLYDIVLCISTMFSESVPECAWVCHGHSPVLSSTVNSIRSKYSEHVWCFLERPMNCHLCSKSYSVASITLLSIFIQTFILCITIHHAYIMDTVIITHNLV